MKKKLMMVAVLLGALSLGACVDDNESQSVTDVRQAKAKQLEALAEQAKLQGEAAKITAEAEKAYKEAYAKLMEAQAGKEGALTEQIQEAIRQSKVKFDAELDAIKAEYEERYWKAKNAAKEQEYGYLDKIETRLQTLYVAYSNASETLSDLQYKKADREYLLAKAEISSANLAALIAKQVQGIEAKIRQAEIELAAWENYQGIDKSEIEAQYQDLLQKKYEAYAVKSKAEEAKNEAEKAFDKLIDLYDRNGKETSTVKAVAAIQKYLESSTDNQFVGYFSTKNEAWNSIVERANQAGYPLSYSDYQNLTNAWGGTDYGPYYMWNMVVLQGQNQAYPVIKENLFFLDKEQTRYAYYYSLTNVDQTVVSTIYADNVKIAAENLGTQATADAEATGAYARLANAEKTLADNKAALTKAQADVTALEGDYKKAQAAIDAAQAELEKAQEAVAAIDKEIEGYNNDIDAANRQKNYAETEKIHADNAKSNAENAKLNATSDKTNATADLDAAKAELAAATTDAEKKAAQDKIDAANKAIAAADALIKDADARIAAAIKEIEAADAIIKAEDAKIAAANEKIAAANVKRGDAQAVEDKAQRTLSNAVSENAVVTEAYKDAKNAVTQLEGNIKSNEESIAAAKDNIEDAIKALNDAKELQAAWTEMLDALTGDNKTAYEAEVKALAKNEIVLAYLEAEKAFEEAVEAYNEADAAARAANGMIQSDDVHDAAAEILECEETIAQLKKELEELKSTVNVTLDTNSGYSYSTIDMERYISLLKSEIESLTDQIKIQEEIVKLAKARLDAAIAAE